MPRRSLWSFGLTPVGAILFGCTITLPVVGSFDDYNAVFRGTVRRNPLVGGGTIQVAGVNFPLQCEGEAVLTKRPTLVSSSQGGFAELVCEDGSTVQTVWTTTTSAAAGVGSGQDREGRRLKFAFGMTEEEAAAQVQEALRQAADLPPLPIAATRGPALPAGLDLPLPGLETIREVGRPTPPPPTPPPAIVQPTP